jgi:hypothetical protein
MKQKMPRFSFRIRRIKALRWFAPPLCLLLISCALQAQFLVKPVNLTYITQRADIIVRGHVTEVVHETLPNFPNIYTLRVTLSVDDMMRGPSGNTYTFREIFLGRRAQEGKLKYQAGEHLLLFMTSASKYGLSSPIGIEQGRFHISQNSAGSALIANEISNAGLFNNVALAASDAGQILPQNQLDVIGTQQGPVQLNDFLSLVKNLTSLSRIQ